jgi:hypothetical protein
VRGSRMRTNVTCDRLWTASAGGGCGRFTGPDRPRPPAPSAPPGAESPGRRLSPRASIPRPCSPSWPPQARSPAWAGPTPPAPQAAPARHGGARRPWPRSAPARPPPVRRLGRWQPLSARQSLPAMVGGGFRGRWGHLPTTAARPPEWPAIAWPRRSSSTPEAGHVDRSVPEPCGHGGRKEPRRPLGQATREARACVREQRLLMFCATVVGMEGEGHLLPWSTELC